MGGCALLFDAAHLASQQDLVAHTLNRCNALCASLRADLGAAPTQLSVSLLVNNLQNYTLMFTSVLRARVPELPEAEGIRLRLGEAVEAAEKAIGDIFDEARDVLVSGTLRLTPQLSDRLTQLQLLLGTVQQHRALVAGATQRVPVPQLLRGAAEQLRSITELHAEEEDTHILALVLHLANLADALEHAAKDWDRRLSQPALLLHAGGKVLVQLSNVRYRPPSPSTPEPLGM